MKKMCALAVIMMILITAGVAEETWGILTFMAEQGVTPVPEKLMTECWQQLQVTGSGQLNIRLEEALMGDEALYLAVTAKPMQENTLVIPYVPDISAEGSLAVMDHVDYEPGLSVREYAMAVGCGQVLTLRVDFTDDQLYGLEYAAYDHAEDGTLRMILQYGCMEPMDKAALYFSVQAYDAESLQMTDCSELLLTCGL